MTFLPWIKKVKAETNTIFYLHTFWDGADYVLPMAEFLVGIYNISLEDGILLSLSGLQETSYYVTLLSKMKITNNDVSIIRKLYTENLNYGKHCY